MLGKCVEVYFNSRGIRILSESFQVKIDILFGLKSWNWNIFQQPDGPFQAEGLTENNGIY